MKIEGYLSGIFAGKCLKKYVLDVYKLYLFFREANNVLFL